MSSNLPLIDVHAHLDHALFESDLPDVIERARQAGVKKIIANGVDPQTNRKVLQIAKKYPVVKPALGIYPPDALRTEVSEDGYPLNLKTLTMQDIEEELEFIKKAKPIALGEVGLDYKTGAKEESGKKEQKQVFQKFIELSEKLKVPLIVHSRKAEPDVVEMLESSNAKKVVLHCFSGKFSLVKRARDNGWSFSIPVNVVRSEQFQNIVAQVNLSQLLTETDAPYLSPFPGKRNEPAFVLESLKKIAEIKQLTLEDTANNILMNYKNLFE
jgi:TatD DNase family protein